MKIRDLVAGAALSLAFDASFQAVQWVVVAYLLAIAAILRWYRHRGIRPLSPFALTTLK